MKPTVTPWKGAARFSTAARRCNGPNVAPKAMIWVLAGPGWIHRSARLKALTLLRRREGAVMLRTDAELGVGPGGLALRLGGGRVASANYRYRPRLRPQSYQRPA